MIVYGYNVAEAILKKEKNCKKIEMTCLCLECKENREFHPNGHCTGCAGCRSVE